MKKLEIKKPGKLSLNMKITDRDKKLLTVLAIVVVLALSYYILYQPMSTKLADVKAERLIIDQRVEQAKSDLANEQNITLEYQNELAKGVEASVEFFPKVYPYKDRYVILLDKILRGNGVTSAKVDFSDPEISGVMIPLNKSFTLPNYPLGINAAEINKANPAVPADTANALAVNGAGPQANAQPENALTADAVVRLPVEIEFEGSYGQYRAVISSIEKLNRAISLEAVTLDKQGTVVKATLEISFYIIDKVDSGEDTFNNWTITGTYGKGDPFN